VITASLKGMSSLLIGEFSYFAVCGGFSLDPPFLLCFLNLAIIAAIFGFGGIAAGAAGIAKILFFIFLILFVLSLILGRRGGGDINV
jgi:uncharacterized membrane protein YtjA (UPF0391 family)